jgi:hypothetical protein
MPIALEITLILVLAALTLGLLPLLLQLNRTAKGLDAFLLSSRKDLTQIAEDVHASRLRMDLLAATLQTSLDELSASARVIGDLGRSVKELHTRYQCTIENVTSNLALIIGGISAVLAFFKSKQQSHPHEQEQQS